MQDHLDLYAISECTGDHTYDRVARPHRTVWAGIEYLLFKTGPVTSTLVRNGRLLVRGQGKQDPLTFSFILALDRELKRASRR